MISKFQPLLLLLEEKTLEQSLASSGQGCGPGRQKDKLMVWFRDKEQFNGMRI